MQWREDTNGVGAGGKLGGANSRQRNNFGPPWQESYGMLGGGGDRERDSRSNRQREVVIQRGSQNSGTETGDAWVGK